MGNDVNNPLITQLNNADVDAVKRKEKEDQEEDLYLYIYQHLLINDHFHPSDYQHINFLFFPLAISMRVHN